MREQVEAIASEHVRQYLEFEAQQPIATIAQTVEALPTGLVEGAIGRYQRIIRGNSWYFPILTDVDIPTFLQRWSMVHTMYLTLAQEIFLRLVRGESLSDQKLLERVIRSETMRGWVGKRSPSGLDAMLEARTEELEAILSRHFNPDIVNDLFAVGGMYSGLEFMTAEKEMIQLFDAYQTNGGGEITIESLTQSAITGSGAALLRGLCRYSVTVFNNKLFALKSRKPLAEVFQKTPEWVDEELAKIPEDIHGIVTRIFEEIRVLNSLNLNLEVKYSFKGWAGLMHTAVFAACSDATNIPINVYAMHTSLNT